MAFGGEWSECVCFEGLPTDDPLFEGSSDCQNGFSRRPKHRDSGSVGGKERGTERVSLLCDARPQSDWHLHAGHAVDRDADLEVEGAVQRRLALAGRQELAGSEAAVDEDAGTTDEGGVVGCAQVIPQR